MFNSSNINHCAWQGYKCISQKGVEIFLCPRCKDAVEAEKDAKKYNFIINYRFCIVHQNKYINYY